MYESDEWRALWAAVGAGDAAAVYAATDTTPRRRWSRYQIPRHHHGLVMTTADLIPGLVAAGRTDRQIAAELGLSWRHVGEVRRRLGLPCNPEYRTPEMRAARSAVMRRLGPAALRRASGQSVSRRRAALMARYNLPPDLTATQAKILFALLGGPQTVAGLVAQVRPRSAARAHKAFDSRSRGGRNLLTDLVRRGLVAGHRQTRGTHLYLITLNALALLARAESP